MVTVSAVSLRMQAAGGAAILERAMIGHPGRRVNCTVPLWLLAPRHGVPGTTIPALYRKFGGQHESNCVLAKTKMRTSIFRPVSYLVPGLYQQLCPRVHKGSFLLLLVILLCTSSASVSQFVGTETATAACLYTKVLLTGGWDNTVQFWDMRVGHSVKSIFGPHISGDSLDICGDEVLTGSWWVLFRDTNKKKKSYSKNIKKKLAVYTKDTLVVLSGKTRIARRRGWAIVACLVFQPGGA